MTRRNVQERTAQVAQWLAKNHPAPRKVEVKWVAKIACERPEDRKENPGGDLGDCSWKPRKIIIRLSRAACRVRHVALDTLIHEWAHAMSPTVGHTHEWAVNYGTLYRAFYDDGGAEVSLREETT